VFTISSVCLVTTATQPADPLRSGAVGKQIAEQRLREAIARRDLVPGQWLIESEVGEQYGVTRNSARMALAALVDQGLVERISNRGARVRGVSTAEAIEIMECRMVLDGLIARKAAEVASDKQIERLEVHRRLMAQIVAERDLLQYSDLIQEHHALVRQIAQHPIASSLVEKLQAQVVRHQFDLSLGMQRAQQSLDELSHVVDAIASRNPQRAELTTRAHLKGVIAALVRESRA